MNRYSTVRAFIIVVGVLCITLIGGQNLKADDHLPVRPPTNDLPERPVERPGKAVEKPGAHIQLHVSPAPPDLWTEVEWQGEDGTWHLVEGWRAPLGLEGERRWRVSYFDFGKGPYRWTVYRGEGGRLLTASQPFTLPDDSYQIIDREVTLPAYLNGDFDLGNSGDWEGSSTNFGDVETLFYSLSEEPAAPPPHSGDYATWLGGENDEVSRLAQEINIPKTEAIRLKYVYQIASDDFCGFDIAQVRVDGEVVAEYQLCFDAQTTGWQSASVDVSRFAGRPAPLEFTVQTDDADVSNFFVDTVSIDTDSK